MSLPDFDTSVGHSFGLEVDGIFVKEIVEVSGLKMEQDVIELKQNTADGKYVLKRLPGSLKAGEVALTRGLTDVSGFEEWIVKSRADETGRSRIDGVLTLSSLDGSELRRYRLENVWPKSLEISTVRIGGKRVYIETLVVVYGGAEIATRNDPT